METKAENTLKIEHAAEALPGAAVLLLQGRLTLDTMFPVQDELRSTNAATVVVDLSGVPYADSAGLGCLVNAYVSCQRTGRKFALAAVPERVMSLMKMTRLDTILPQFESWQQAITGPAGQ